MSRRVVHLSSAHFPTDVRVFRKECRALAAAGYDVTFVCAGEGEPEIDGVHMSYVPRAKSRRERITKTVPMVRRRALELGADLYHFHDPELALVGLDLLRTGVKVVYDVHEDLPRQIQNKEYIPPALRGPLGAAVEFVEGVAARRFSAIVAATEPIARRFSGARRVEVVQNFPFLPVAREDALPYADRDAKAIYVGNIDRSRGAEQMLAAMRLLPAELGATLDLIGRWYPPPDEATLRDLVACSSARLVGWRPHADIAALLDEARIGLSILEPRPNYLESQPTKLFEYMAAGIPVIASNFPAWRRFVEPYECGLLVDPDDAQAIADAMCHLLTHPELAAKMGKRGREAAESVFNWDAEAQRLVRLYASLLA